MQMPDYPSVKEQKEQEEHDGGNGHGTGQGDGNGNGNGNGRGDSDAPRDLSELSEVNQFFVSFARSCQETICFCECCSHRKKSKH